ncbi:MAG: glutamate synthase-related protein [Hyphomonas sp.]
MIEIKLSQGAKPGYGGVLPGAKVTHEIAEARGIEAGQTCVSLPAHSAFSSPVEMMEFAAKLQSFQAASCGREIAVGNRWEVLAFVQGDAGEQYPARFHGGRDGGERRHGRGARGISTMSALLRQGLVLTRNALVGTASRMRYALPARVADQRLCHVASSMALGADWVNTARGFMFALGCIQSLNCHNNHCPTGIATSDKSRQHGLDVSDKTLRVANFHRNTVKALTEVVGAAGCRHPSELTPRHIMHRVTEDIVRPADESYDLLQRGQLLHDADATHLAKEWNLAQAGSFRPAGL